MRKIFRVFAAALLTATITTPHLLRAAGSANVVISEFRVRGPNGGNDEFIGLYNESTSAVSIGSWQVKGQNANPAERIVAVGDFNAFEFSDGYVDVMNTIRGDAPPADQVVLASGAGDLVEPNPTDHATPPNVSAPSTATVFVPKHR